MLIVGQDESSAPWPGRQGDSAVHGQPPFSGGAGGKSLSLGQRMEAVFSGRNERHKFKGAVALGTVFQQPSLIIDRYYLVGGSCPTENASRCPSRLRLASIEHLAPVPKQRPPASLSPSLGSKNTAPEPATSWNTGMSLATTGHPFVWASSIVSPNPSMWLGTTRQMRFGTVPAKSGSDRRPRLAIRSLSPRTAIRSVSWRAKGGPTTRRPHFARPLRSLQSIENQGKVL